MSLYNRFLVFCIFALFIMVTFTGPVFAAVNPISYSYEQFQDKYVTNKDIIAGQIASSASHLTINYTVEPNVRSLPFYQDFNSNDFYYFATFPAKFWNSYWGCAQVSSRGTPLTGVYDSSDGVLSNYQCGYSPVSEPEPSNCPLAVLLSSGDHPIVQNELGSFVIWGVQDIVDDVCHNSCLYDVDTATVSTCYANAGGNTGYCNFGMSAYLDSNNQPESCAQSNDYDPSKTTGTPIGGSGDGGDGGDTGGGDTGGGDGTGGDVYVTGGELGFTSSGDIFADAGLALEIESTKFESHLQGVMSDTLGGEEFGEFKQSLLTYSARGSCPALSFDFLGVQIYSDTHCVLFEDVRGLLSLIFMAAWTFLGIRIALSA